MSELVDMSLDDIIKRNRSGNKKSTTNNHKRAGGNQTNKPRLQRLRNLGARSGITRKSGTHQSAGRQQASPRKELTRLHVSNLNFRVTNEDVRELFSEIGPLKKAALHYDKDGHSLGTAEVAFTTREAAIRAIKKYNQVPLDGRPMSITLVPNTTNVRSPTKGRIGVKPNSGISKTKSPRNKDGRQVKTRGQPKFQKREPKKQVTAEELDAELESYTARTRSQG